MSQAYTVIDDWNEFSSAFEKFAEIVTSLRSPESRPLDHGQLEQRIETEGRELLRRLLQGVFDHRAATEPVWEGLEGDGQIMRNYRRSGCQRHLSTLFGEVAVTRRSYRAPEAASRFSLDAQLNLSADKYSDGLRRHLAQDVALMSFDEATARLGQTTRGHIPKRQSEEVVVKVAQDFEAFYQTRQAHAPEVGDDLLVLTTDGKGIVMRREDLREETRKAAERAEAEPKTGLSPGGKLQRKRMSTVASVYSVAPYVRSPDAIMNPEPEETSPRPKAISGNHFTVSLAC